MQHRKLTLNEDRKNSAFILLAVLSAETLSFFLVLRQRFFNDLYRCVRRADVIYMDFLAFQFLVILEKALQYQNRCGGNSLAST